MYNQKLLQVTARILKLLSWNFKHLSWDKKFVTSRVCMSVIPVYRHGTTPWLNRKRKNSLTSEACLNTRLQLLRAWLERLRTWKPFILNNLSACKIQNSQPWDMQLFRRNDTWTSISLNKKSRRRVIRCWDLSVKSLSEAKSSVI